MLGEVVFNQEQGQDRGAKAVDCGLLHGRELVELHGLWPLVGQVLCDQPAAPVTGAALELQEGEGQGLGWGGERRCEAGGGDGLDILVHQFEISGTGPVLATVMDGGIEIGGGEVEGFQAGGQVDGHLGVQAGKGGEAGGQPVHAERGQDGEVQRAAGRVGAQGQGGLRQGGQGMADLGHIVFGGGGQVQAALVAACQLDAQLVGHDLQLAGDGALGQVQFGGGGRGGAEAVEGFEGQQRGQGWQVAAGEHMRFPHGAAIWFR